MDDIRSLLVCGLEIKLSGVDWRNGGEGGDWSPMVAKCSASEKLPPGVPSMLPLGEACNHCSRLEELTFRKACGSKLFGFGTFGGGVEYFGRCKLLGRTVGSWPGDLEAPAKPFGDASGEEMSDKG